MKKLTKTIKKVGIALVALMAVAMFAGCANPSGGLGDGTLNEKFDFTDPKINFMRRDYTSGYLTANMNTFDADDLYTVGQNGNLRIVQHFRGHGQTEYKTSELNSNYMIDYKNELGIVIGADSLSIEMADGSPIKGKFRISINYEIIDDDAIVYLKTGSDTYTSDDADNQVGQITKYLIDTKGSNPKGVYIGSKKHVLIHEIIVRDYDHELNK